MNIALSYLHHPQILTRFHEQALEAHGHVVQFVGPPSAYRPGYHSGIAVNDVLAQLPQPTDIYFWIEAGSRFFPVGIEDSSVPTAGYFIDVHLGHWRETAARFFDIVFVAECDYVQVYREIVGHPHVYWLPLCIAPEVFRKLNLPKVHDIGFVGVIGRAHRGTPRARQLQLLRARFQMNDPARWYDHAEICQVYNQSRIVFNTSISGGVTQRIMEGIGSGSFVLTDTRPEALGSLFELGSDLIPFVDDQDLLEKVEYYLAHEDEREAIAQRAYVRARESHTYEQRADEIVRIFRTAGQGHAPMRSASAEARLAARTVVYKHLHMLDALFDDMKAARYSPPQRIVKAMPIIARRTLT
jgi:hypothetical protein